MARIPMSILKRPLTQATTEPVLQRVAVNGFQRCWKDARYFNGDLVFRLCPVLEYELSRTQSVSQLRFDHR